MEEDNFFDDMDHIQWKMPEPNEEVKELMKIYPVILITNDEFQEWCR